MIVYQCEDTLESIFTAIYLTYEQKRDHEDTMLVLHRDLLLFAEYVPVETDSVKVQKVIRTLVRRFGEEDYYRICCALASEDPFKAQAVYQTVVKGLKGNVRPGRLFDNLADDNCSKAHFLARNVSREIHHLMGFVRFAELENGVLYAVIGPKNNTVPFLMPHFADRFPKENFVIYDETRDIVGIHPSGKEWFLTTAKIHSDGDGSGMIYSRSEEQIRELFLHFCGKISILERENLELQRHMLPLRFRKYMVE